MTRVKKKKVAYIVVMYPRVSHTFVQNEVWALRDHNVDVTTISIRKPGKDQLLSRRDEFDAAHSINVLPLSWKSAQNILMTALRHPVALSKTIAEALRKAPKTARAKLWSLFYVTESLVVWNEAKHRDIRHLHAHFANVGSDVAHLASFFGNLVSDTASEWTWSFTMHGPAEFSDVKRFGLKQKAEAANAIACISDFCRSQLMALTPPESWAKMQVVHCGVDLTRFAPVDRTGRSDQGRPVEILSVGRLVPVKAQHLLIEAIARLKADGVNVHLTLVGDGPSRGALQRSVSERQLNDVITFTGNVGQDHIRNLYEAADIFALPSFAEGVPVVLMEAMATGLPVVTTRIAGIPELVEHGESGLVVSPGNLDALLEALRTLLNDDELRHLYGKAGRKAVEEGFDIQATSRQVLSLFNIETTIDLVDNSDVLDVSDVASLPAR